MKSWAPILFIALATAAGCQTQPKPSTSPSVLDVSGPPSRSGYSQTAGYQPAPGYQPTPAQYSAAPARTTTPPYMLPSAYPPPEPMPVTVVEAQPPTAIRASSSHRAANNEAKYIVKQGDTLYHIAKVRYGDGKQWQQIASANPGVSPTTLKVGQVLVIP